ncbi:MAG: hypothetical protein GDA55_02685 [Cellvibrionales bacterium]|nr:hypothetical protein [Cellvibrionales bacterium]
MSFKNLFIEHDISPEAKAWVQEEIAEQEERYRKIEKQMADLEPMREKWYQEFFDRLTTTGFSADGDMKVKIKPEELPVKPKEHKDQVIWKYGTDSVD